MYKEAKDNEKKEVFYFDRVEVIGSNPITPTFSIVLIFIN